MTSINLENFDTAELMTMSSMFENCGNLTSLDLGHLITDYVTDMSYAFNNCSSLNTLIVKFNTPNTRYMQYMFASCVSLTSLNIGSFFTANVEKLDNIFENDEGLQLYMDFKTCANLRAILPDYVTANDIS